MVVLAPQQRHTPEELLAMPDGQHYELVNGELVEKKMGTEASWIGGQLFARIWAWNEESRQGWVLPAEASYQCFPEEPARVRRPDTSFIRFGRLPEERVPEGHTAVPPDLAVEVVSPNDLFSEVRVKVGEYLRAGVRVVWIVDPKTRSVEVARPGGQSFWLQEEDELTEEEVLPGFRCRVGSLFHPVAPVAARLQ